MAISLSKEPFVSVSELKQSPKSIFDRAKKEKKGVYVLKNNSPEVVVTSVEVYESLVDQIDYYQEKIFDLETAKRLKEPVKLYNDEEVRGEAAHREIQIDPNDGWE
ncbi:MAG: type II toxin-antitoxin system Phd/YefM family antitoxin [Lactobacillaceae bacterium]